MLMSMFLVKVYVMKYQLHEADFGVDVIQRDLWAHMYKFWGWLSYFLMGIQFIVTAVNNTWTLDNDDDGGGVQCTVQCVVGKYKWLYVEASTGYGKPCVQDWVLRIALP